MRIHLVRHGKPDFWATRDFKISVTGEEFSELWQKYTESGILPDSVPPSELLERSRSIPQAYSSDIVRAIESARKLLVSDRLHRLPLFREAEIPHGFWPTLTLPLWLWSTITRSVWLLGYSRNCESFYAFRQRARDAAACLVEKAGEHGEVMLVAHGWINGAIFYHLQRQGWQAERSFQHQYWGWNILSSSLIPLQRRQTILDYLIAPLKPTKPTVSERISHEQKEA